MKVSYESAVLIKRDLELVCDRSNNLIVGCPAEMEFELCFVFD